jgi:tetratricopeptide (TPR) repeat protein
MQKHLMIGVLLLFFTSVYGQRHKKKNAENQPSKDSITAHAVNISQDTLYTRMYHNGMRYGDYRLAITALHSLYAIHPDNINYLDSLCILYGQTQNYAQCIFTGREVLKKHPDNVGVISAMAVAEQQLGMYKEALEMYQNEYARNNSIYASYQVAVLQYAMQKYGEAQASLDRLMLNPLATKEKISFSTGNNSSQMVIYMAAAQNLMGIIYQDLKDVDRAKQSFKKALEIQPDFVLAQNNLDYLNKTKNTEDHPSQPEKITKQPSKTHKK